MSTANMLTTKEKGIPARERLEARNEVETTATIVRKEGETTNHKALMHVTHIFISTHTPTEGKKNKHSNPFRWSYYLPCLRIQS